jgi:hypothetical protein
MKMFHGLSISALAKFGSFVKLGLCAGLSGFANVPNVCWQKLLKMQSEGILFCFLLSYFLHHCSCFSMFVGTLSSFLHEAQQVNIYAGAHFLLL